MITSDIILTDVVMFVFQSYLKVRFVFKEVFNVHRVFQTKLFLDSIHFRLQIIYLHELNFAENHVLNILPNRNVQTQTKLRKCFFLNHIIIICFRVLPLHEIHTTVWKSVVLLEEWVSPWHYHTTKIFVISAKKVIMFFVFVLLHKIIS